MTRFDEEKLKLTRRISFFAIAAMVILAYSPDDWVGSSPAKPQQDNVTVSDAPNYAKPVVQKGPQNYLVIESFASSRDAKAFVDGALNTAFVGAGHPDVSGEVCFVKTRAPGLRWRAVVRADFFDEFGLNLAQIWRKLGVRPWVIKLSGKIVKCDRGLVVDAAIKPKAAAAVPRGAPAIKVFGSRSKTPRASRNGLMVVRHGARIVKVKSGAEVGKAAAPLPISAAPSSPDPAGLSRPASIRFESPGEWFDAPKISLRISDINPGTAPGTAAPFPADLDIKNTGSSVGPKRWDYGASGLAFTAGMHPSEFTLRSGADERGVCRQTIQIPSEKLVPTRVADYVYEAPNGVLCDLMYVVKTNQGGFL